MPFALITFADSGVRRKSTSAFAAEASLVPVTPSETKVPLQHASATLQRRRVHSRVMPFCGAVVFRVVEGVSKRHAAFRSPAHWFGIRVRHRLPELRH
jgi:hypothetical protein